ncbi:MAG TPA: hypothetical protein VGH27_02070 [Streptosporangiaceae bacterium]|jgi:hypothetical protein
MRIRTSARIAATLTAVITTTLTAASAASAGTAACTGPSWSLVRTPTPPAGTSVLEFPELGESDTAYEPSGGLESASTLSAGNAMLIGSTDPLAWDNPEQPWILHLANDKVTQTAVPVQGPVGFFGSDGSFDSSTDGWLLGEAEAPFPSTSTFLSLDNPQIPQVTEQWDGGDWTMTPVAVSPEPNTEVLSLDGIAAVSPDDAWAVGTTYMAKGRGSLLGALIEQWDGTSWNIVPNPASSQPAVLTTLSVVSADNIWAVGYQDTTGKNQAPFVEHYDGTQWSALPTPPVSAGDQYAELDAVSVDSSGNVWAAGYQQPASNKSAARSPLTEQWNGSTWTQAQLPALPAGESISSVYAASPSDVWASTDASSSATGTGVFLNWNGSTWTPVAMPGPKEYGLNYTYPAITGTGPTDVWAAGYSSIAPQIARLSCS